MNHPTNLIGIWINCTPGHDEIWLYIAKEIYAENDGNVDQSILNFADRMESGYRENAENVGDGIYHDLLISALNQVCWLDIAIEYVGRAESENENG